MAPNAPATSKKPKPQRTARQIYADQNRIIHRCLVAAGMPYKENKGFWNKVFCELAQRTVYGLSDMTLAERRAFIQHLGTRGYRIFNPGVPRAWRNWKKADDDRAFDLAAETDPQLRMIYGMWLDLGQEPRSLRTLVQKRYRVGHERWLLPHQRTALLNYLKARLQARGGFDYER